MNRPVGVAAATCASVLGIAMALGAAPARVSAETLADAIALAYQSNPTLQSQRAQLRALDETYVQARAGFRPTLSIQAQIDYSKAPQNSFAGIVEAQGRTGLGELSLNQPVYTGGRTETAVRAAEADVLAGREQLQQTEENVLQSVIQAYVDVRRDLQILAVREADLSLLQNQVDDAQARFKVLEVTETDVLQSRSQLNGSRALLSLAQGQLQSSRAEYAAVVGQNPGDLAPEPILPALPTDVDQAFDAADKDNPTLRQAEITEEASRIRIAEAKAANLPTIGLSAGFGYTNPVASFSSHNYERAESAMATFSQPLFTGGVNASQIRRATQLNTSDRIQIEATRRTVVETVSQAWNQMLSLHASALSDDEEVRTARGYFADTEAEYRVGQRSTLDVLIAEETLRDAQISLLQARHDAYLNQAALLAAMGHLRVATLVAGAPQYDPRRNFDHVKAIGAVPWEGLVETLDSLGAPSPGTPRPISAPAIATAPQMSPPDGPVTTHPGPSLTSPTAPVPNTTSPSTPQTLGQGRDGAS